MHRFVQKCSYLKLAANIEAIKRFEPLEYDPLVNPRVHELAEGKNTIRNVEFRETYRQFLWYCCEK